MALLQRLVFRAFSSRLALAVNFLLNPSVTPGYWKAVLLTVNRVCWLLKLLAIKSTYQYYLF